jgi:hypothetical protein
VLEREFQIVDTAVVDCVVIVVHPVDINFFGVDCIVNVDEIVSKTKS